MVGRQQRRRSARAIICAEMPLAAAKDGLFPARFGRLSSRRVPAFGIISSTALASVAVVISYMGANGATVFTTLVLMTGVIATSSQGINSQVPRLTPRHSGRPA